LCLRCPGSHRHSRAEAPARDLPLKTEVLRYLAIDVASGQKQPRHAVAESTPPCVLVVTLTCKTSSTESARLALSLLNQLSAFSASNNGRHRTIRGARGAARQKCDLLWRYGKASLFISENLVQLFSNDDCLRLLTSCFAFQCVLCRQRYENKQQEKTPSRNFPM
jgi:hypothetical protein